MFIGNTYIVPSRTNLPGQGGGGVVPTGDFLALESALTDLILLESGDNIELETA